MPESPSNPSANHRPCSFGRLRTALGAFVHPAFLGLAAFVGAGLVFAGVTDTCGLGMLLARMPWNQAGGAATCAG